MKRVTIKRHELKLTEGLRKVAPNETSVLLSWFSCCGIKLILALPLYDLWRCVSGPKFTTHGHSSELVFTDQYGMLYLVYSLIWIEVPSHSLVWSTFWKTVQRFLKKAKNCGKTKQFLSGLKIWICERKHDKNNMNPVLASAPLTITKTPRNS